MKKLLVLMLSLLMIVSLGACSSDKGSSEPVEEENTRPIKTVTFFDKEYSTPVTLDKLAADGVELKVLFMDKVSPDSWENIFLSKNDEYIRVGVYNNTNESLSVTDPSLPIYYISLQYDDMYENAAKVPSFKVEGVGITENISPLKEKYGDPEITDFGGGVIEDVWTFEDNCTLDVVEMEETVFAFNVWLPIK